MDSFFSKRLLFDIQRMTVLIKNNGSADKKQHFDSK
jgi:hypothetical protein